MNQRISHLPAETQSIHGAIVAFAQRAADALLIAATLWIATLGYDHNWNMDRTAAAALAVLCFLAMAPMTGLYRSWRGATLAMELRTLATTWLFVVPALLLTAFLTKTSEGFSRVVVSIWFASFPVAAAAMRVLARFTLRRLRASGHNIRRVAIAGMTESGLRLKASIGATPETGNRVIGIFDDRTPARLKGVMHHEQLAGTMDELIALARSGRIDTVYVALPMRAERRIRDVISRLADTTATVCVATDFFMFDLMHARWTNVGDMPVVSVFDTPFTGLGGWVKRAEDIVLSTLILMLIALPMAIIAAAVKLTSPGPVFFKQTRYGLNGAPISVWKFRSMSCCDNGTTIKQATKNDARITPLGRFLRRSSLDELPQFINVFLGDMSVVGPRPHAVAHNELYRSQIRGYMLRHKVKPGITGWAQVNGWRGETEVVEKMEHRVEHDLYYIDNWSLLWDLEIVALTVFGRQVRNGAY